MALSPVQKITVTPQLIAERMRQVALQQAQPRTREFVHQVAGQLQPLGVDTAIFKVHRAKGPETLGMAFKAREAGARWFGSTVALEPKSPAERFSSVKTLSQVLAEIKKDCCQSTDYLVAVPALKVQSKQDLEVHKAPRLSVQASDLPMAERYFDHQLKGLGDGLKAFVGYMRKEVLDQPIDALRPTPHASHQVKVFLSEVNAAQAASLFKLSQWLTIHQRPNWIVETKANQKKMGHTTSVIFASDHKARNWLVAPLRSSKSPPYFGAVYGVRSFIAQLKPSWQTKLRVLSLDEYLRLQKNPGLYNDRYVEIKQVVSMLSFSKPTPLTFTNPTQKRLWGAIFRHMAPPLSAKVKNPPILPPEVEGEGEYGAYYDYIPKLRKRSPGKDSGGALKHKGGGKHPHEELQEEEPKQRIPDVEEKLKKLLEHLREEDRQRFIREMEKKAVQDS